ncbi:unnamed protein product [Clonostachys chloroleuca]|uniref:NACHT domain-containing protein n=1 Tax=Clonostachys chloroleuca TaxID=1926264 RepID=A0AA35M4B0_9HYPO|nr:unnamed protein product [Clonostachys chloroleuca]
MDVALRNAAPLRPEIALAKAISEFESSLTKEHKSGFRSLRSQALSAPPSAEDVMRFTASLNSQIQKSSAAHRCFGTRFTNIMQCVQKYAALGDVVVGGSQNIIACGIWALVRLTIQVCIGFGSYLDKVSHFFMTVGQSAPRYESMALLYRRSKLLSHYMSSYFLVIVQTCHEFMLFSRKSFLGQLTASMDDSKLRDAQSRSERLGAKIREEVSFLTTQTVESEASENNLFRALVGGAYSWETQQRKLRQRAHLLEALSSSDHETPFRQARKCGVSTVFEDEPTYLSWEQSTVSASLVLVGKLGSGKSVTMASIIDNLYLSSQDSAVPFFFCRHDNAEALTARAVIGSLGRQLIDKYFKDSLLDNVVDGVTTLFSLGDVLRLVKDTVPRDARIHFVLDGVDECQDYDAIEIIKALGEMQKFMHLPLLNIQTMTMPEKNPDIGKFIEKELERRFLWVALQIDSLCDEKSDAAIRSALQDLPPDLFSTFDRILKRSRKLAHTYQTRILKTIVAAHRPLTVDEIREVISVEPGNTDWSPDMLVNNIHGVLACCGSLVTVDEENLSVYLIHQSVMQFLLEKPTATSGNSYPESHFTMEEAQRLLGESVITYLNCSLFERQVSKDVAHEVRVGELPSRVMQEALAPAGMVGQLAIRWLKSESNPEFDAKKALTEALRPWLRDDAKIEVISSFIRHALHDRSVERSKIVSIIWRYIDSAWNKDSGHYDQYVELAREALIRCLQLRDWDLAREILLRNASQSSILSIRAIKISLRHYIIESNLLHYCADAADWDGLTFLTKDVEFPLNNSIARFSSQYDYQTPLEIALRDDFENILSFGNAVRTIQILLGSRSYGNMKRQSYETEAFEAFEDFEGFEAFEPFVIFLNRLRDLPDFSPGMSRQVKQIIDAILNVPRDSDKDYTVQLLLWCILQSYSGAFKKSDIQERYGVVYASAPHVVEKKDHYNLLIDATLSFRTTEDAKIMVPSQLVDRIRLIDRFLPRKLHSQGCERFEAQIDAVPGWLLLNIPQDDSEDAATKGSSESIGLESRASHSPERKYGSGLQ